MSKKHSYLISHQVVSIKEAQLFYCFAVNVLTKTASRKVQVEELKQTLRLFNQLRVNAKYRGTDKNARKGTPISYKNGSVWFPRIFGDSNQSRKKEKRLLERLINNGIIEFTAHKWKQSAKGKSREFYFSKRIQQAIEEYEVYNIEDRRETTLDEYADFMLSLSSDVISMPSEDGNDAGAAIDVMGVIRSKTSMRSARRTIGTLIVPEFSVAREVGDDGVSVSEKIKTLMKPLKEGTIVDLTEIDSMLDKHTDTITRYLTKSAKLAKDKRKYFRELFAKLRKGVGVTEALESMSNTTLPEKVRKSYHALNKLQNQLSILSHNEAIYYYREIETSKHQGILHKEVREYAKVWTPYKMVGSGRIYTKSGLFQSMTRQLKDLLLCTEGDNYDIESCHLNILKQEMKARGIDSSCLDLISNTGQVFERFIRSCGTHEFHIKKRKISKTLVNSVSNVPSRNKIYTTDSGFNYINTSAVVLDCKLSLASTGIRLFKKSDQKEITKKLLYSTLYKAGVPLKAEVRYGAVGDVVHRAQPYLSDRPDACLLFAQVITKAWNQFCKEIGLFDALRQLADSILSTAFYRNKTLTIKNTFGRSLVLATQATNLDRALTNISNKSRRKALSHVMQGQEIQFLYEFVRDNPGVIIHLYDHDGFVIKRGSTFKTVLYVRKAMSSSPYRVATNRRQNIPYIVGIERI